MADTKKQIAESKAFKDQKQNYQTWSDLCKGGLAIERQESYLPRHPYESEPQYKIRMAMSTYKNHARPISTVFTSSIWRKRPSRRDFPKNLDLFIENVDNNGTKPNLFFRTVNQKAAECGIHFVLVDSTKAPQGAYIKTKKDANDYRVRPYLVGVSWNQVPSWGFDDNGLAFVVIREVQQDLKTPFTAPEEDVKFKIWYRDMWEQYKETDKGNLELVDEGLHPCGEVPLVPCYFRKVAEMVGESCIADVASLLLRAYNLENALDKSLFDTAFPQQGFFGFDKDQIDSYIKSSSNGLANPDWQANSKFIEPEGRAFEALDNKIKNDEVSIREIALRMIRPNSKVGESAEAKKIDNQQLHSQLTVFSENCQDAELRCWKLMLKWLNESGNSDIKVEYNRDFDVTEVSGDLLRAFSEMRRNNDLSRETLFKILQKAEVQFPDDFDIAEEVERIEEERRSAGTMGELGSRFLTSTGGDE